MDFGGKVGVRLMVSLFRVLHLFSFFSLVGLRPCASLSSSSSFPLPFSSPSSFPLPFSSSFFLLLFLFPLPFSSSFFLFLFLLPSSSSFFLYLLLFPLPFSSFSSFFSLGGVEALRFLFLFLFLCLFLFLFLSLFLFPSLFLFFSSFSSSSSFLSLEGLRTCACLPLSLFSLTRTATSLT